MKGGYSHISGKYNRSATTFGLLRILSELIERWQNEIYA